MVSYAVFLPVVVTLFLSIIGVYVYVSKAVAKSRAELSKALKENEKSLKEQTDKLANHIGELAKYFQEFRVGITDRLARIETIVKDQG